MQKGKRPTPIPTYKVVSHADPTRNPSLVCATACATPSGEANPIHYPIVQKKATKLAGPTPILETLRYPTPSAPKGNEKGEDHVVQFSETTPTSPKGCGGYRVNEI